MNWLNIHTPALRSPEFIGSEPIARATWLYVTAYCCEQENGGRIAGAREWKDRQWQQTCGVTLAEVEASAPLLSWDGPDLVALSYPVEKELEIRAKRIAGKKGGKHRAKAASEAQREAESKGGSDIVSSSASRSDSSRASTEGEGERKEKKKGIPPVFDVFWSTYPRKVAKDAARKAFTKIAVPIEAILAAIESAKATEDWLKDGGRFIPHPATWLNGKRWEDEGIIAFAKPQPASSVEWTPEAFKTPQEILAERKAREEQEAAEQEAHRC